MSKDPAFLFYPGDYLRDTQCLSESVQVAYDRIMCEHMRNICISKQQLKFFTKRLNDDQKEELMMVLTEIEPEIYQITWVAESIVKRRKYSESRRNNRKGSTKKTSSKKDENISSTYVEHMENENEDVNESKDLSNKSRIEKYLISSFSWQEAVIRSLKSKHGLDVGLEQIKELIKIFCDDLEATDDLYKTDQENKMHFARWVAIQIKNSKNGKSTTATGGKPSRFEQVMEHNMETARKLGLDPK